MLRMSQTGAAGQERIDVGGGGKCMSRAKRGKRATPMNYWTSDLKTKGSEKALTKKKKGGKENGGKRKSAEKNTKR